MGSGLGWLLVAVVVAARHPSRRPTPTAGGRPTWWCAATRRRRVSRRRRRAPDPDLGLLLTEVATRLRSGAPPETAWRTALGRAGLQADDDGVPNGEDGVPRAVTALATRSSTDPGVRASLLVVRAACRLTHHVGAPLAQVLEQSAQSITEAREAHDARRVAMAGPAATARLLAGLPLFGLLLGVGLGADPVTVALDGGWGTLSLVLGLLLVAAGRRWSTGLVAAARAEGATPAETATTRGLRALTSAGRRRGLR